MNNNKITQVYNITDDELISRILNGLEKRFIEFEKKFQPKEPEEWITRKQVAELLSISLVTVSEWSKKGILSPITIGRNRVRFKRSEVIGILTKKD